MTVSGFLARWELATRPIHPESRLAMQRRWADVAVRCIGTSVTVRGFCAARGSAAAHVLGWHCVIRRVRSFSCTLIGP